MRFSKLAITATLAAAVSAISNVTYITETVTALTTVCPAATTLAYNGVTYTATASQTITITNCPCIISYKPTVTPVVYCSTCAAPTLAFVNTTIVVPTLPASINTTPIGTSASSTSSKPAFTGAANKVVTGSAVGLTGLLGIAAFFL